MGKVGILSIVLIVAWGVGPARGNDPLFNNPDNEGGLQFEQGEVFIETGQSDLQFETNLGLKTFTVPGRGIIVYPAPGEYSYLVDGPIRDVDIRNIGRGRALQFTEKKRNYGFQETSVASYNIGESGGFTRSTETFLVLNKCEPDVVGGGVPVTLNLIEAFTSYLVCPFDDCVVPYERAFENGTVCYGCGGCCKGGPCVPGEQYAENAGEPAFCTCKSCTECGYGEVEVSPCQTGITWQEAGSFVDYNTDRVCANRPGSCDGIASYCVGGVEYPCHVPDVQEEEGDEYPYVYRKSLSILSRPLGGPVRFARDARWGRVVTVRPCVSDFNAVHGWCGVCPAGKILVPGLSPCWVGRVNALGRINAAIAAGTGVYDAEKGEPYVWMVPYWNQMGRFLIDITPDDDSHCTDVPAGFYGVFKSEREGTVAVECPAGAYCPGGGNLVVCPHFTYNAETGKSSPSDCLPCDLTGCAAGTYIRQDTGYTEVSGPSNQTHPCGNWHYGAEFRQNPYPLCEACPVGSYCPEPTAAHIAALTLQNLNRPTNSSEWVVNTARCGWCRTDGSEYLDLLNGCDPFAPGQTKPTLCVACPDGWDCSHPYYPNPCLAGTYARWDRKECVPCDTSECPVGSYRPSTQCQTDNLWDEEGTQPFDRCVKCDACRGGVLDHEATGNIHSQNAVCADTGLGEGLESCGIVCRPGYWISVNPANGAVTCNPCSECGEGEIPANGAATCDGKQYADAVCAAAGTVGDGMAQTSCPDFGGVYVGMEGDASGGGTGDVSVFENAGQVTSSATDLFFVEKGWCIETYPISASGSAVVKRISGLEDVRGFRSCSDFTSVITSVQSTEALGFNIAVRDTYLFGDIGALLYDPRGDTLYAVATSFRSGNPGDYNSFTSVTNRHDVVVSFGVAECLASLQTPTRVCEPRDAVSDEVWSTKYGSDTLNAQGPGYGIADLAIVRDGADYTPDITHLALVQDRSENTVTILWCEHATRQCSFLREVGPVNTYVSLAGSIIAPDTAYGAIHTDLVLQQTNFDLGCVIDRVNTRTGEVTNVLVNACDPDSNNYILNIQTSPAYPNWLWITRTRDIIALDLTDVDAYVTQTEILDLTLLSPSAKITTSSLRPGFNVTIPPNHQSPVGLVIHLDAGRHLHPACLDCPEDRYQPADGRTHPYCRPTAEGSVPTADRQSIRTCVPFSETEVTVHDEFFVPVADLAASFPSDFPGTRCTREGLPCSSCGNIVDGVNMCNYFVPRRECRCSPGYRSSFSDTGGVGGCVLCGRSTYQPFVGSTHCEDCPVGGWSAPGSTSITACQCPSREDYVSDRSGGDPVCAACPPGTSSYAATRSGDHGWLHVRVDSGGNVQRVLLKTIDSPRLGYEGYRNIWDLYEFSGFPLDTTQVGERAFHMALGKGDYPIFHEYPFSTYEVGGVCTCNPGNMFVMDESGKVACVVCPRGFYCPANHRAENMNPYDLYETMAGEIPLPAPLTLPTTVNEAYPVLAEELYVDDNQNTRASLYQTGSTVRMTRRAAGGAVLCPNWRSLITNASSRGGAWAVSQCDNPPGTIVVGEERVVEDAETQEEVVETVEVPLTCLERGGFCRPGNSLDVYTCASTPNTVRRDTTVNVATVWDMCQCPPGMGWVDAPDVLTDDLVFLANGCEPCTTPGYASPREGDDDRRCRACAGDGEYSPGFEPLYPGQVGVEECLRCTAEGMVPQWFDSAVGVYRDADARFPNSACNCPAGTYTVATGEENRVRCDPCPNGFFCAGTPKTIAGETPVRGFEYLAEWRVPTACFFFGDGFANFTGRASALECYVCDSDRYYDFALGKCLYTTTPTCDPGYYSPPQCYPCGPDTYCPNGVDLVHCGDLGGHDGFRANSSDACQPAVCPADTYRDEATGNCTACPNGLFTKGAGATNISECGCPPGMTRCDLGYHPQFSGVTCPADCWPCPAGSQYCEGGNAPPVSCPDPQFPYAAAFSKGPDDCRCASGEYSNSSGECDACPAGSYCPTNSRDAVFPCPEDYYSDAGIAGCIPCSTSQKSGTTGGRNGTDDWGLCFCSIPNTFHLNPTCEPCPAGSSTFSSTLSTEYGGGFRDGPLACRCPDGQYNRVVYNELGDPVTWECAPCPAGRVCVRENPEPVACPNENGGWAWADRISDNVTVCRDECPGGSYCVDGVRLQCPITGYCPPNSTEPIECPSGGNAPRGSDELGDCGCPQFWYLNPAQTSCVQCPGGLKTSPPASTSVENCSCTAFAYGRPDGVSEGCRGCPVGFSTYDVDRYGGVSTEPLANPHTTFLENCTAYAGYYGDPVLDGAVTICPFNHYCPWGANREGPTPCPALSFTVGTGAKSVAECVCAAGTRRDSEGGACSQCPPLRNPGAFCSAGATVECADANTETAAGALGPGDCKCLAGYYSVTSPPDPVRCALVGGGFYSSAGSNSRTACPANTVAVSSGSVVNASTLAEACECAPGTIGSIQTQCTPCPAGSYCPTPGDASLAEACPANFYCPEGSDSPVSCAEEIGSALAVSPGGSSDPSACVCEGGSFRNLSAATVGASCSVCGEGTYCPEGTVSPIVCPVDAYCPPRSRLFVACPDGTVTSGAGRSLRTECECEHLYKPSRDGILADGACEACAAGEVCPNASTLNATGPQRCPRFFTNTAPVESYAECRCAPGWYANPNSSDAVLPYEAACEICPFNHYCPSTFEVYACAADGSNTSSLGSISNESCACATRGYQTVDSAGAACEICPVDHYCPSSTEKIACQTPQETQPVPGSTDGCVCQSGYSFVRGACVECPVGFYCPDVAGVPVACPASTSTLAPGAVSNTSCACLNGTLGTFPSCAPCPGGSYCPNGLTQITCPEDHYCPPGSADPTPCPNGGVTALYFFGENGTATGKSSVLQCRCDYASGYAGRVSENSCALCPRGSGESFGGTTPPNNIYQLAITSPEAARAPRNGGLDACDCYCDANHALDIRNCTDEFACKKCVGTGTSEEWYGNFTNCALGADMFYDYAGELSEPYCAPGTKCTKTTPGAPGTAYACNHGRASYNPVPSDASNPLDPAFANFAGMVCATGGGSYDDAGGFNFNHGARFCGTATYMQSKIFFNDAFENCQCSLPGQVPRPCFEEYTHPHAWRDCYCTTPPPLRYRDPANKLQVPREYCYQPNTETVSSGGCEDCGYGLYCPKEDTATVNHFATALLNGGFPNVLGFGQSVGSLVQNDCAPGALGTFTQNVYCPDMPRAVEAKDCPANSHMGDLPPKFDVLHTQSPWYKLSSSVTRHRDRCYCNGGYHANGDTEITNIDTCVQCNAGSYCPANGTAEVQCPAGFYCPTAGLEDPVPCLANHGCVAGATSQTPCGSGSSLRGGETGACRCDAGMLPQSSGDPNAPFCFNLCPQFRTCERGAEIGGTPCPDGTYCPFTNMTAPITCPPGTYCPQGENNPDILIPLQCPAGSSSNVGAGTVLDCFCVAGRYQPVAPTCSDPLLDSSCSFVCEACPPGQTCPDPTSSETAACPEGFVCGTGTVAPATCPPGFRCPENTSVPIQCLPGDQCLGGTPGAPFPCPAGFYCPVSTAPPVVCPGGSFCPEGSGSPVACPAFHFCNPGAVNATPCSEPIPEPNCVQCVAGTYCTGPNITTCPAGSYCPPESTAPVPCPAGSVCAGSGNIAPAPCPAGTFSSTVGATNETTDCGECGYAAYCGEGSSAPTACPAGLVTTTNRTASIGGCVCPAGLYSPSPISVACLACTEGYACPSPGVRERCSDLRVCPTGSVVEQPCPTGFSCELGIGTPCPEGFYCESHLYAHPIACPPGTYCPGINNTAPTECPAGSYCPGGEGVPVPCPTGGFYCPVATPSPVACPVGSFCPDGSSAPTPCPAGYYCAANSNATAPCEAGTFCPAGSTSPAPTVCPAGSYCPALANAPIPCVDVGFYCPVGTGPTPVPCPAGAFSVFLPCGRTA
jgi:hypothetical protein